MAKMNNTSEEALIEELILRKVVNVGSISYYNKDNQLHRIYGPAVILPHGTRVWAQYGLRHREDGPAVEYDDGAKEWYKHGLLHRDGKPAIEYIDGSKEWWEHGKYIRSEPG